MATIESWSVDLATIGPAYPMLGTEVPLVIIGVILWIGWHVLQGVLENKNYEDDLAKLDSPEKLRRAIEEQRLD